jgi:hypothetical protein
MEVKQKNCQISRNFEYVPKNPDCYLWKKLFAEDSGNIKPLIMIADISL